MPKFALIGSGLAGGLLAAYLGRRGYDVDLYEGELIRVKAILSVGGRRLPFTIRSTTFGVSREF